jgi:hypothetical protein
LATGATVRQVIDDMLLDANFMLAESDAATFCSCMPQLSWFQAQREGLGIESNPHPNPYPEPNLNPTPDPNPRYRVLPLRIHANCRGLTRCAGHLKPLPNHNRNRNRNPNPNPNPSPNPYPCNVVGV